MIKVYAVVLALCFIRLVVVIFGTALSSATDGKVADPSKRLGDLGQIALGSATGFAVAGLAAEFSPLDLSWQVALLVALGGLALGALWTLYAVRQAEG